MDVVILAQILASVALRISCKIIGVEMVASKLGLCVPCNDDER